MLLWLLLLAAVVHAGEDVQHGKIVHHGRILQQSASVPALAIRTESGSEREAPGWKRSNCDFDGGECEWGWNSTVSDSPGFLLVNASQLRLRHAASSNYRPPQADASNNPNGGFLYLEMETAGREVHAWSGTLSHTRLFCQLHVALAMANMTLGNVKVVIETKNTSWLVDEKYGNNRNSWEGFEFLIGRIQQEFRIIIEVTSSLHQLPAHLLMDNIRLVDCFPAEASSLNCSILTPSPWLFVCSKDNDDICINRTQVCDLEQDCWNGEDEKQSCERVPDFARCTFEDGWCGWENSPTSAINWTRQNGSASAKRAAGPAYDHTYLNISGMYLFVNMSTSLGTKLGASAVLESQLINPPPKYHSNRTSPYYRSCTVRFFYHQLGPNSGSFGLIFTEKGPSVDKVERLWFLFGSKSYKGDNWNRQIVPIPENITNRYMLQFEVRRGLRARGDLAIDDVSMSPECFGLNVPDNETSGYNYNAFDETAEITKAGPEHEAFANKDFYIFTSCGVRGRLGPTQENCTREYNGTNTNVTVMKDAGLLGTQKWIVPQTGYYTIIAKGARGGKPSDGTGVSKGATAMGVVHLNGTQPLFILVGQEGGSACHRSSVFSQQYSCGEQAKKQRVKGLDVIKELSRIESVREGGGGGGASFVYLWYKARGRVPLVIGAGGGGMSSGHSHDDGRQQGLAMDAKIKYGVTGFQFPNVTAAGAGGGWEESNMTLPVTGQSLMMGGQGGQSCGRDDDVHHQGAGGFGGGGGGCVSGGGGGGFAGGSAYSGSLADCHDNGHGGYSYVSNMVMYGMSTSGSARGAGAVVVIPAVHGCGCAYWCIALDEHRSTVRCICPKNHRLLENGVECAAVAPAVEKNSHDGIIMILAAIFMVFILALVSLGIYKHHKHLQKKKAIMRINKVSESDVQLNRLRLASDSMMTEYNPNYEFGGGTYTMRDLPQIAREHLGLVKALGQGAFGEVYQGVYRYRSGDAIEMAVAVKTLPELSTSQAETDFLMEALIMSKFSHPNIVHFFGVCFDRHPRYIVLELLAGGDLKNFLRESRPKPERPSPLNMKDLLLCAMDVAKGCHYLEENRFVHRDIAARNCLLTTKGPGRCCKIADFGMARDIYRSDYYKKGGKAMLPIKWMPPEAFQDGIFTSKTDVWSFGVMLWEVMSLGYMPYTGCGNREVMQQVVSGGRLEPPCNCPEPVYSLMSKCWHPRPEERPTFMVIIERIGYCLQDPDVLNTPLPVFNRLTWTDRDSTATQSEAATLRGSADYLEPNQAPGVNTPESLKSGDWREGYSSENSLAEPLLTESTSRSSELLLAGQARRPLTATLSLDASTLARQPVAYSAHSPALTRHRADTAVSAAPYSVTPNGRIVGDNEISC